jgi:hypothetical protein
MGIYVGDKRYAPYVGSTRRKVVRPLPYDAKVEYMLINAGNYFLTDYYPNENTVVECVFKPTTSNILFCGATDTNKQFELYKWGNTIEFHYGSIIKRPEVEYSLYTDDYLKATLGENKGELIAPDATLTVSFSQEFNITVPLAVFGLNRNGTITTNYSSYPVKSFVIKESGVTLHDYIPVRIGNIGYFFDKITGQLNATEGGSGGGFTPGPDINN